jgi:nucleoside-diphosphate-sugar epimerase
MTASDSSRPAVLVTGVSGNLGQRLQRQLAGFRIIGVDFKPPSAPLDRFEEMDLGEEESCDQLLALISSERPVAVVHLAFVIDPVRTGVVDADRMWRINVAGTARVMEAIAVANRRDAAPSVSKFIFPSSVSAYGPELPCEVSEDCPLAGHTLLYAIHKRESDLAVQQRAALLGECSTYILRPHIFTGASMQNYLVGALRGTPTGQGRMAADLRQRGKRMPLLLPMGRRYRQNRIQFVHVDDMARLIAWLLRREAADPQLTILNIAGRGPSLTVEDCAAIGNAKVVQVPGRWLCRLILRTVWELGISAFPPDAFPYLAGSYCMDTSRLRDFLGDEYERIMQHTTESALRDSFADTSELLGQRGAHGSARARSV